MSEQHRILIVDDNVDAAETLAMIIRTWGHDVQIADGFSAMRIAESFRPQTAIVDLFMPGTDGYTLAQFLRKKFADRITLIALTGFNRPENLRRAREAGFDETATKPVEPNQMKEYIRISEIAASRAPAIPTSLLANTPVRRERRLDNGRRR